MRCKYIATYVAHEIALPAGSEPIELYSDAAEGVRVTLATDPTELLKEADRGAAIINLMLRGLFDSPDPRDFEVKLAERMVTIAAERKKKASGAPVLVVSIDLGVEPDLGGAHADQPNYSVYWDAIDKDRIRAAARPTAETLVASAIIASGDHLRYDRLGESVYLIDEDERVLYSISAKGHAASLSVRSLAPELPTLMRTYVSAGRRPGGADLRTVFVLLRASVDTSNPAIRGQVKTGHCRRRPRLVSSTAPRPPRASRSGASFASFGART